MNTIHETGGSYPGYPGAKNPQPADPFTTHAPLPVAGYKAQSQGAVDLVNQFKRIEEEVLRVLDGMKSKEGLVLYDQRWLNIGRTHLEQAFMAINRSVFRPERVRLPSDPE